MSKSRSEMAEELFTRLVVSDAEGSKYGVYHPGYMSRDQRRHRYRQHVETVEIAVDVWEQSSFRGGLTTTQRKEIDAKKTEDEERKAQLARKPVQSPKPSSKAGRKRR